MDTTCPFVTKAQEYAKRLIDENYKVVMIGDASIYNYLYFADEDFKKIFKIKAEFDNVLICLGGGAAGGYREGAG